MRAALVLACAAVVGACHPNAPSSAATSTRRQAHALEKELPATLEVGDPLPGTARTARVRVWVDDDYRAQNVHWREQIEEQLDEANQLLTPAVGLRLVAKELKPWPAHSADLPLGDVLAALETIDAGDDVDWVIGYASALPLVEGSFDALGLARPLGRHVVVRGGPDALDAEAFAKAFPDAPEADRERVLAARHRHKQTVVLMHQLAHALGVPHETEATWIMATRYAPTMATLSRPSREIMQLALETWLQPRATFDRGALAARLVGYFESNPWGGWVTDDKDHVLADLRVVVAERGKPTAGGAGGGLTGPALEQLVRAQQLARGGKLPAALAELEALAAAYPATVDVRQAICEVKLGIDGPGADGTVAACQRVLDLEPTDPRPHLALAVALFASDQRAAAIAQLAAVEAVAGDNGEVWQALAELYTAQGLVTLAEAAAARLDALAPGAGADTAAWAQRTRGRYGLPPDGPRWKIAVADEADYVAAVRGLLDAIYADKFADARRLAAAADKRWQGAPGLLAARCDLALRQKATAQAMALCDRAIAAWSGAAWAQYLRGVMLAQRNKIQPAITALRAAIAADPTLAQAYRTLAKALDRANDGPGRAALALDYQQRFGKVLP